MNAATRMRLLGVVAGVAAAVAVASPAQALSYGEVTATNNGRIAAGGGGLFHFSRSTTPGPLNDFTGTLLPDTPDNYFIGFCMEIGETIVLGSENWWTVKDVADAPVAVPGAMGVQRASDIAKLVGLAFNGLLSNALLPANSGKIAAFQLALWEIAIERLNGTGGNYDVNAGGWTYASGGGISDVNVRNTANGWLTQINQDTTNSLARASGLLALSRDVPALQDMLVQTPIPAAAWLLGSGLLGLFGIARRRRTVAA